MALFEQILASYARKAAKKYPNDTIGEYDAAAQTFRLPFWDWASNAALPDAVIAPTVHFNGPAGPDTMPNPLYGYQFPNYPFKGGGFGGFLARFSATKRCTTTSGAAVGKSDTTKADNVLLGDGPMLTRKVYAVFTQSTTFESMASTANAGASFEDPHNYVHNDIGCLSESGRIGHMGDLSYSGFDPVFFLHHANVDRLFALWQAIHPNSSVFTSGQMGHSVFGTAAGLQTADSPLLPFRAPGNSSDDDSTSVYHTSRSVEATRTFGYTYPELPDWSLSPDELAASARAAVNSLYGQAANTASGSGRRRWQQKAKRNNIMDTTDYSIELSVDRAQLPLPCSIELHLVDNSGNGSVSTNTSSNKLGGASLLTMPSTGTSYTLVPLRHALLAEERGSRPPSFVDSDSVVAQLHKQLRIVVLSDDGTSFPTDSVSSLHVELQQRSYKPAATSDDFPEYGPITHWLLEPGLLV
ncbi:tyrosinase precursor [Grosmannia clavigera kw1407]|uniref:Tyrosinase n=1 Tax=Grosmannia clavigera (strain kw1407 / UAMH 11150) TaxID=655863 RepID=F0XML8_GROCL|nr:tyrosinase precursor [Grosmannia clavigera kw1407]EFX01388.1 tyrosinase precursor [Grosmannia clavigera kw1407]